MAGLPVSSHASRPSGRDRLRLELTGVVQGVGFRPYLQRLAAEIGVAGYAANSAEGLVVEIEAEPGRLRAFVHRLQEQPPRHARMLALRQRAVPATGASGFRLRPSLSEGRTAAAVPPDLAICASCVHELFDPRDRRHLYPFTTCTECGPRYSILEALPFDRERTTMQRFALCSSCAAEYRDANDRRCHAQTIACHDCGPQLALWSAAGKVLAQRHEAVLRAADAIRAGDVVAIKGLGGFQLLVDGFDDVAVQRLRKRKQRPHKPFAVLCEDLEQAGQECAIAPLEARWLASPAAPIVLLERRAEARIAASVAPDNPWLGIMLPATGVHHLLLRALGRPLVATSGNLSGEPICTGEDEALHRLAGIADCFLVHDRPIVRAVDDSVLRVVAGRELGLRHARGLAPGPIASDTAATTMLAVGGHLKSTVGMQTSGSVLLSQHLGDLDTVEARQGFERTVEDYVRLFGAAQVIACDMHPEYHSVRYARGRGVRRLPVQHHHAHALACLQENHWRGPALSVVWDGTGLGADGTLWGGEFLRVDEDGYRRVAHLRTFPLPGGEAAIRTPRLAALGLLYELYGARARHLANRWLGMRGAELDMRLHLLERGVNCPRTSSAGRLFDAVAALTGLCTEATFEAQAAMQLEYAAECARDTARAYPFRVVECTDTPWVIDYGDSIEALLADRNAGLDAPSIAARFHATLAEIVAAVAQRSGEQGVALSGGCFQNRVLTEMSVERLQALGLQPLWHRMVPPNDAGLAFGQLEAAARALRREAT